MLLKHALARLAAAPMFTIFSVVSLAAGVAVTTAVYSVVDTMLVTDLGVREPERLVFVSTPFGGRLPGGAVSDLDFADLRAAQRSFAGVSASTAILPSVTISAGAELLTAEAVDGAYFTTLALEPQIGRLLHPDDEAAAARVAVLSDDLWRRRFAADRDVIGRTIRINGQPFEVIGVAPARYQGLFGLLRRTRLWIPLAAEASLGTTRTTPATLPRERRRIILDISD